MKAYETEVVGIKDETKHTTYKIYIHRVIFAEIQ